MPLDLFSYPSHLTPTSNQSLLPCINPFPFSLSLLTLPPHLFPLSLITLAFIDQAFCFHFYIPILDHLCLGQLCLGPPLLLSAYQLWWNHLAKHRPSRPNLWSDFTPFSALWTPATAPQVWCLTLSASIQSCSLQSSPSHSLLASSLHTSELRPQSTSFQPAFQPAELRDSLLQSYIPPNKFLLSAWIKSTSYLPSN